MAAVANTLLARLLQTSFSMIVACGGNTERAELPTEKGGAAGSGGEKDDSAAFGTAGTAGQSGAGGAGGSVWLGGAAGALVEPVACDGYPPVPILPSGQYDCGDLNGQGHCEPVCYRKQDASAPCLALDDPQFPTHNDLLHSGCSDPEMASGPHCSHEGEERYQVSSLCCYMGVSILCIGRPLLVASSLRQAPLRRRVW